MLTSSCNTKKCTLLLNIWFLVSTSVQWLIIYSKFWKYFTKSQFCCEQRSFFNVFFAMWSIAHLIFPFICVVGEVLGWCLPYHYEIPLFQGIFVFLYFQLFYIPNFLEVDKNGQNSDKTYWVIVLQLFHVEITNAIAVKIEIPLFKGIFVYMPLVSVLFQVKIVEWPILLRKKLENIHRRKLEAVCIHSSSLLWGSLCYEPSVWFGLAFSVNAKNSKFCCNFCSCFPYLCHLWCN